MRISPNQRRLLSVVLLVIGGLLIFLAPENVWIGGLLAVAGIAIELVAIVMLRRADQRK